MALFYMHNYVHSFSMHFEISQQGASQASFQDGDTNLTGPPELLLAQRARLPTR